MLTKFFSGHKDFNSPSRAMNYLLRESNRHTDYDRSFVKVLRGNPNLSVALAESLTFKQKYKMGCLSFEESNISDEQKQRIMDSFEQMAFAGLEKNQYDITWIEHTDKGRLELNFFSPSLELATGKRYQMYYHPSDEKRFNLWRDIINLEYGLSSPTDPKKRRALSHDEKISKTVKNIKEQYKQKTIELYQSGAVKNRDELIRFFENQGERLSRVGKDYITIITTINKQTQDGIKTVEQKVRLKGGLFERTPHQKRDNEPDPTYPTQEPSKRPESLKNAFYELMHAKITYNQQKYPCFDLEVPAPTPFNTQKPKKERKTHEQRQRQKQKITSASRLLERTRKLHDEYGKSISDNERTKQFVKGGVRTFEKRKSQLDSKQHNICQRVKSWHGQFKERTSQLKTEIEQFEQNLGGLSARIDDCEQQIGRYEQQIQDVNAEISATQATAHDIEQRLQAIERLRQRNNVRGIDTTLDFDTTPNANEPQELPFGIPIPDLANLDIYSPNDNGYNMADVTMDEVFGMPNINYNATPNMGFSHIPSDLVATLKALSEQIPNLRAVLDGNDKQAIQASFTAYVEQNFDISHQIATNTIKRQFGITDEPSQENNQNPSPMPF